MKFFLKDHNFVNEVQNVIQIFFPNESYQQINIFIDDTFIYSEITENKCISRIYFNKSNYNEQVLNLCEDMKLSVKQCLYILLSQFTGYENTWGVLTGIRPSKKAGELLKKGFNDEEVIDYIKKNYYAREDKIKLMLDVYQNEEKVIINNNGIDTGLYIGIPFCPSRCKYCSFASVPILKYNNKTNQYLDALEKEMTFSKKFLKNRYLESIYIGGGTPTSLNNFEFERLLFLTSNYFNIKDLKEFTVEAGRPDTINLEKLKTMKKYNVSRISINPQTMNNTTLINIGRNHSSEDFIKSFQLAREQGFSNINVDLILGLPNETYEDILNTFSQIEKLRPESLTIHTLSVKTGSEFRQNLADISFSEINEIEKMISFSKTFAKSLKMLPYYMYRQKNMIGNFENVGYSIKNFECIYNVQIMEEKQTILALGAGGVTKKVDLKTNRIDRVFNVKSVDDYLNRIDEMIIRKENLLGRNFYEY